MTEKHEKGLKIAIAVMGAAIAVGAVHLGSLMGVCSTFAVSTQDALAIEEAFVEGEKLTLAMGSFVSDTGLACAMTPAQLTENLETYNEKIETYYTMEHPNRVNYPKWHQELIEKKCREQVDYTVDSGVSDYDCSSIKLNKAKDEATVQARCVAWKKEIRETENGRFKIEVSFNQDDVTIQMAKEDGLWKNDKTLDLHLRLPEDVCSQIKDDGSETSRRKLRAMEQAEEIVGRTYGSFGEALAAAQMIDMEQIDPFCL